MNQELASFKKKYRMLAKQTLEIYMNLLHESEGELQDLDMTRSREAQNLKGERLPLLIQCQINLNRVLDFMIDWEIEAFQGHTTTSLAKLLQDTKKLISEVSK